LELFGKMTENGFGFGNRKTSGTIYDQYVGQTVSTSHNGNTVVGVLKEIDINNHVAYFQPSVIGSSTGEVYLQETKPVQLPFPLGGVFPLKETLEEYIVGYNKNLSKTKSIKDSKK